MATAADVVRYARNRLRDFPRLFSFSANGTDGTSTIFELPVVCVDPATLSVMRQTGSGTIETLTTDDYTLLDMSGDLRLHDALAATDSLFVEGQNYIWFTDSYANSLFIDVVGRHEHDPAYRFSATSPGTPEFEVTAAGVVVEILWGIYTETSFDIDLRNPEGVDLPVSQRVAQVERLLGEWVPKYMHMLAMLNIGIDRIEIMTLRRVSRTTNRFIPEYTEQEIDDVTVPVRGYPPIDAVRSAMVSARYPTSERVYVEAEVAATTSGGDPINVTQYQAEIAIVRVGALVSQASYFPATWLPNKSTATAGILVGPGGDPSVGTITAGRYTVHTRIDLPAAPLDILSGEVEFFD